MLRPRRFIAPLSSRAASQPMLPLTRSRPLLIAGTALLTALGGWWLYRQSQRVCCAPPPADWEGWLVEHPPAAAMTVPDGFAVEISSGTGSLAPEFHYDYTLRIDRSGAARLTYWPGYGQEDSLAVFQEFSVPDSTVRILATLAVQLRDAPGPVSERDIPVGGRSPHITLRERGRVAVVGAWQPEPFGSLQSAMERIARTSIPADVWATCEAAQRRYASALHVR